MPKVSVIMGVYNGAQKVEKSVHSILNQSFKDFEFIICDDGSTDNSVDVLQCLAKQDNRIKLLANKTNLGLAKTLNNCLDMSKGEYIARMDDDDYAHKDRFLKQVEFLESNIKYSIVGTSRNMFDESGIWGESISSGERTIEEIFKGKSFAHPTVMMRRKEVIEVGGYSAIEETRRAEDYDLWCKMHESGYRGFNLNDILLDYYEARDSYKKRKFIFRIYDYKLRMRWRKKLNLPFIYSIYAIRPIVVGLLPASLLIKYHKKKFKFIRKDVMKS